VSGGTLGQLFVEFMDGIAGQSATAIAFYHHPDDLDVSRAVLALG